MANSPSTAHAHAWATVFDRISVLRLQADEASLEERHRLEFRIAALEEHLLTLPAPSLGAVEHKLRLLWSARLHGLDQDSRDRCLVLSDLQGLAAELIGASA